MLVALRSLSRLGFGGLIGALSSRELVDQDLHEALEFLRKIRNSAFHGEYLTEKSPSPQDESA
jgi:hypothetical protein